MLSVAFNLSGAEGIVLFLAGLNPASTLQVALGTGGGGVIALTRHAVAALLNAYAFGAQYTYSASTVIAMYKAALASGGDVDGTAALFEAAEHPGGRECPI